MFEILCFFLFSDKCTSPPFLSPLSLFQISLPSHLTLTLNYGALQLLEQAEITRLERMEAQRVLKARQEALRREEEEREDREESERMKMDEGMQLSNQYCSLAVQAPHLISSLLTHLFSSHIFPLSSSSLTLYQSNCLIHSQETTSFASPCSPLQPNPPQPLFPICIFILSLPSLRISHITLASHHLTHHLYTTPRCCTALLDRCG